MPLPVSARRPRAPFAAASLAAIAAASALAACGDKGTGVDPLDRATSPIAKAYVDSALAWEHYVFYWITRVDTAAQNTAVRNRVRGLGWTNGPADSLVWNVVDYSLDPWLRKAPPEGDDLHSLYFPPSDSPGITDSPPDPFYQVSGTPLAAAGQSTLAYLWLPTYSGKTPDERADSTQAVIRALDQNNPCGWVLDLRGNPGGYGDAMMAGINPIFGDAPASRTLPGYGGSVDRDGARVNYFVSGGAAGVFDPDGNRAYTFVRTSSNYTLKRPGSPVAILTGPFTASAGEFIVAGFRGGPVPSRSFGEPTYGVTTQPYGTYLKPDSGYLNVTAAILFDRTGKTYGSKLQPDQLVTGGPTYRTITPTPSATDPVIQAASAWLRQQSACTGAPAVASGPALSRAASPAALPGAVRPVSPEALKRQVNGLPRWLVGR